MGTPIEQQRARTVDYVLGHLGDEERAAFERAMLDDEAFADEVQRTADLLEAARQAPSWGWTEERAAANLGRIQAAIDAGVVTTLTPPPAPLDSPGQTAPLAAVAGSPGQAGAAATRLDKRAAWLAAAALVGLAGGLAIRAHDLVPAEPSSVASAAAASVAVAPPTAPGTLPMPTALPAPSATAAPAPPSEPVDLLASTSSAPSGFPGHIYATAGASWRADADHGWTVYLGSGALLVEWLPLRSEHLRVRTADAVVEVTGTVFFVDASEPRTEVAVVEGSVEIGPTATGPTRTAPAKVRAGGAWRVGDGAAGAARGVVEAASARIDLDAHRRALATRTALGELPARVDTARPVEPSPARDPSPVAEPPSPSPSELRQAADAAMARSEFMVAANLLERLLAARPAASESRAARLDLARIYLHSVRRPQQAAAHLRVLLTESAGSAGEQALASTLRAELCGLGLPDDFTRCTAGP
jgi:hypothetical protein